MPLVKQPSGSIPVQVPDGRRAEAELISRCVAGERAAHDELYRAHRRQVAANLYRVLGDRSDLDDLVQEVFVIAFRGLPTFRGDARLSTWIYRICINVALGRIRSRMRRPPPILRAEPALADAERSPETPERALERRRAKERVYAIMERMAPKKRLVLYLHEIEGRSLKEIAYLLDANPVTVRTRLHYAKREFYALLSAEEPA